MKRHSAAIIGMASALAGSLLIAVLDAMAKLLTATMGTFEIMFYRSALIAIGIVVLLVGTGRQQRFVSRRWPVNLLRAAFAFVASTLIVLAVKYLPLADALALFFVNPLIVAVLSRPLLGERVSGRSWAAIAAGFGGALLIIQPGGAAFDTRALIPIGAALAGALQDLTTRRLHGHDHPQTVLLYTMALSALGGALLMPATGFDAPSARDWMLLTASAVAGFGAYYFFIQAYQLAPPARVAPLRSTTLIWAGLLGFLIWGHTSDLAKLAGAAIVIGSGLFVFYDSHRKRG